MSNHNVSVRSSQWGVVPKKNIEAIVHELQLIEQRDNVITAEAVVAAARPARSPIHSYFDWDNNSAADKFRLWQARMLIRTVNVIYEGLPDKQTRGFVNIKVDVGTDEPQRGYLGIARVLSDADMRSQLLERARHELREWRKRYNDLNELAAIFEAIDNNTTE